MAILEKSIGGTNPDFADIGLFRAWIAATYSDDFVNVTEDGIRATVYEDFADNSWSGSYNTDFRTVTCYADKPLIIRADPTKTWAGKWDSNNITITTVSTNYDGIFLGDYQTLHGFQFILGSGYSYRGCVRAYGNSRVSNCFGIDTPYNASGAKAVAVSDESSVVNSGAANFLNGYGIAGTTTTGYNRVYAINCVCYNNHQNFDTAYADLVLVNCISAAPVSVDVDGTLSLDSRNCATEDVLITRGSGHVLTTVNFVDAASLDFTLASTDTAVMDIGIDMSDPASLGIFTYPPDPVTEDAAGTTLSSTPDLGMVQYVAGGVVNFDLDLEFYGGGALASQHTLGFSENLAFLGGGTPSVGPQVGFPQAVGVSGGGSISLNTLLGFVSTVTIDGGGGLSTHSSAGFTADLVVEGGGGLDAATLKGVSIVLSINGGGGLDMGVLADNDAVVRKVVHLSGSRTLGANVSGSRALSAHIDGTRGLVIVLTGSNE